MAAALAVLALAGVCRANDPILGGVRMPTPRGPLNSANWWARYGEPVNQEALEAAPARPPAVAPAGWHDHGFGYAFGPGACDYTPPCTEWLWAGYERHFCRCHTFGYHWRGDRCGHCGRGRLGHRGCGCGHDHGCGCGKSHGCEKQAPDCGIKAPDCGFAPKGGCDVADSCCGKRHFHWHWKGLGFWNRHCGCDTCAIEPAKELPSNKLAPWNEPALPKPLPEAPDHAAVKATHGPLMWPLGPVR
jgi:hypothetical protein